MGRLSETSQVIRSETGEIINLRLTSKGFWREKVFLSDLDPDLIRTLIAYEDQRYWTHHGVDPLALVRATFDYVKSGEISSGASTLTMQTGPPYGSQFSETDIYNQAAANACRH